MPKKNRAFDRLKLEAMPPGLRLEAGLHGIRIRIPCSILHESELWKWKKIEKRILKMGTFKLRCEFLLWANMKYFVCFIISL